MKDAEQVGEVGESLDDCSSSSDNNKSNNKQWPLHCEVLDTQMENWDEEPPVMSSTGTNFIPSSVPVRFVCFLGL